MLHSNAFSSDFRFGSNSASASTSADRQLSPANRRYRCSAEVGSSVPLSEVEDVNRRALSRW